MTHAQERLIQHHGIYPSKGLMRTIIWFIESGHYRAKFVRDSYLDRKIYKIKFGRRKIPIVYAPNTQHIVTVLPLHAV